MMRTTFLHKSKVTRSFSQKALCVKKSFSQTGAYIKKRIKKERSMTPQRWSRRIRNLPPLTIDVMEVRRRPLRSASCFPERTFDKELKPLIAKRSLTSAKYRRPSHIEIVRVMPVVVYLKNNKPRLKALSDDTEIALKKKGSKATLENIQKIKKECEHLEKKWSRILKVTTKTG